ncbi:hypothetical protein BG846_04206 [Streptomyces fradiae ATCC 10745 = DSM 40063]|uniref:Uncharacterized protein n=1 Tax=Streptomyces fradiae ATCC 10745 = DSM 40063 TaxID=1319510 RepID=A0A1Y2NSF4_STRFR|nr:hypothetical protein BG846_04206 [Streptomyces fradiae ATCC 10745 = DSM 40063]
MTTASLRSPMIPARTAAPSRMPISQLRNWSSRRSHCGRRAGSASSLAPQSAARRRASAADRPAAGSTPSRSATSAAPRR